MVSTVKGNGELVKIWNITVYQGSISRAFLHFLSKNIKRSHISVYQGILLDAFLTVFGIKKKKDIYVDLDLLPWLHHIC